MNVKRRETYPEGDDPRRFSLHYEGEVERGGEGEKERAVEEV